jgi:hypothetical protein
MAYPVRQFHPDRNDATITGDLTEQIPAARNKRRWIQRLVHFDIDPNNTKVIGRSLIAMLMRDTQL